MKVYTGTVKNNLSVSIDSTRYPPRLDRKVRSAYGVYLFKTFIGIMILED